MKGHQTKQILNLKILIPPPRFEIPGSATDICPPRNHEQDEILEHEYYLKYSGQSETNCASVNHNYVVRDVYAEDLYTQHDPRQADCGRM